MCRLQRRVPSVLRARLTSVWRQWCTVPRAEAAKGLAFSATLSEATDRLDSRLAHALLGILECECQRGERTRVAEPAERLGRCLALELVTTTQALDEGLNCPTVAEIA